MYNRYVPRGNTYTRVTVEEPREKQPHREPPPPPEPERGEVHPPDGENYKRVNPGAQGGRGISGNFFSGSGVLDSLGLGKLGDLLAPDKSRGSGALGGLLETLGLEELDSGDLLLLLIILFVLSEGDNLELVITLGLMLLLGLGDKKEKKPDGGEPSGAVGHEE